MKTAEIQYDFTGLHNFVRFVDSANKYVVKVGIFGNKAPRGATDPHKAGKSGRRKVIKGSTAVLTNAELGLIHELGSVSAGIPKRSFLRMPITQKSKEIISDAMVGAAALLAKGEVRTILARLGIACEKWIENAFATGGFGNWKPDKAATIRRKGSDSPLIDTAQLRRSVASKVDEK